ncbi:hypothetical protein HMPREF1554_01707 [Porphyromonas gingivalis F0569]|nr:hypothetical protein HMPREF1554_01707 [Porphyromonas gingivalis F0569]
MPNNPLPSLSVTYSIGRSVHCPFSDSSGVRFRTVGHFAIGENLHIISLLRVAA